MKTLILGGTGAMGVPLVNKLTDDDNDVYVTTRVQRVSDTNVHYIIGNAKDDLFLSEILKDNYDVIVDFMVYHTEEFKERLPKLLASTGQYIFFSSARCYADSSIPIVEKSARLVDSCNDREYLATDEYALAKGREENLLFEAKNKNWTIIRPYITYNAYRLQLGVYEKENWLNRALSGRTIVFPKDMADKKTTLTYGPDVAGAIAKLIWNEKAFAEAFHITTSESYTWGEILSLYSDLLMKKTGIKIKVKWAENSEGLQKVWNPWQIKYDRLFNREFDNRKLESVIGKYRFKPTVQGLDECLDVFLSNPQWLNVNIEYEAWSDKITHELIHLRDIKGGKRKLKYLKYRMIG